jgi:PAS domain S-box-containing protein
MHPGGNRYDAPGSQPDAPAAEEIDMSDTGRSLLRTVGFSVLYVLTTYAGRHTVMDSTNLSLVWPAAGVLAVWAVTQWRSPQRWMDVLYLVVITLSVNHATGAGIGLALVFALANLAQGIVFAVLVRRWLPEVRLAAGRPVATLAELWRYLAASVVSTVAGAAIGPTGVWLATGEYGWESTSVWLARNLAAVLVIGIAVDRLGYLWARRREPCPAAKSHPLEYVLITVVSMAGYYFTFGVRNGLPIAFALTALAVWGGLRLRTTFVALHSLVFGSAAILYTLHDSGPFAQVASHAVRALVVQLFVVSVTIVGLALALGRDERDALLARLRDSENTAVEQARLMTGIVDAMTEGLAVVDENGRFLLRNPAAGRIIGVTSPAEHVADNSFYGVFHPDGTPLAEQDSTYRRIFDGRYQEMDLLIRNAAVPDGRILRMSGAEIAAGADGARRAVVVFHDVTADRRHRDELASFAGVVAHDLLNPLTTVEGWSEALAGELGEQARFERDSVTRIQRAAARMRSLINGLLTYTTARDAALAPTSVGLDDLVRDIATGRLDHAESSSAPMPRFDIGDLARVAADPVLTRQLLENLIGNAIKYTAPGVTPHITVRSAPAGDGFLRISIDDNGIGIPAGQHEAIFQNFHRAHTGSAYAGTGLGLAICKRIVERHGGTIVATGNEAGGSRMTFTLPACPEPALVAR